MQTINPVAAFFKLVEEGMRDEYLKAGYSKFALDGTSVPDEDAMKQRVFEVVVDSVVKTKADKSRKAITQGELYGTIFPDAPGAKPGTADQLDDLQNEVRSRLTRKVWNLTGANPKGYIQRRLAEESLVLCRADVLREMDWVSGVYVTDSPTLIMEDSLKPAVDKLQRVAEEVRAHAAMVTARHPELEARVATALQSGVTRVRASIQLPAFAGNGRKPADADASDVTEE